MASSANTPSTKQRIIEQFDHSNPTHLTHVVGGWWRIWNGLYYHADSGYCLSRMSNPLCLVSAALLHSTSGQTGVVLALENTDYVLDWDGDDPAFQFDDAEPPSRLYEWLQQWMADHPTGLDGVPAPPTCIHGSSLSETFSRGPTTPVENDEPYICSVNQAGSNRSAIIRVTPERGDVLSVVHPAATTPAHKRPSYLNVADWKRILRTLDH